MRRWQFPALLLVAALAVAGAYSMADSGPHDTRPCLPATRALSPLPRDVAPLPYATTGRLLVANRFAETASMIDLPTGKRTTVSTGDDPHDAAVSPDGRWGIVANFGPSRDGAYAGDRLFVIDMATGRVARVIDTGEYRGLHDVAFRPGFPTRALVTAQTSRRLLEVDVVSGMVVGAADTRGDRSHTLAVTADGSTAFTTNEGSSTVSRLDLTTHTFVATFPASPNVEGVAVTRDGKELWVGHATEGEVRVLDATTGTVLAALGGFRHPSRVVMSPDGRRVVVSDPACRSIVVADPTTRQVVSVTHAPQDPPVLVGDIAPDGRVAYAALTDDRAVIAIDLETGHVLARHRAGWAADGLGWGPAP